MRFTNPTNPIYRHIFLDEEVKDCVLIDGEKYCEEIYLTNQNVLESMVVYIILIMSLIAALAMFKFTFRY